MGYVYDTIILLLSQCTQSTLNSLSYLFIICESMLRPVLKLNCLSTTLNLNCLIYYDR